MSSGRCGRISSIACRSNVSYTSRLSRQEKGRKGGRRIHFHRGSAPGVKVNFSDMWFKNPAAGDWTGARPKAAHRDGAGMRNRVLAVRHAVQRHNCCTKWPPHRLRHVRSSCRRGGPGHRPSPCRVLQPRRPVPIDGRPLLRRRQLADTPSSAVSFHSSQVMQVHQPCQSVTALYRCLPSPAPPSGLVYLFMNRLHHITGCQ